MFLVLIVFVLNARGGHERSKSMRFNYPGKCAWSFRILLFLWVASVWAFQSASCCASGASQFSHRDKADNSIAIYNHSMPKRASGHVSVPEALGYKCISCSSEFDTRRAADCHRRHPTSYGTACADPDSIRFVSLTARPDVSAGILRQHYSAPLGTSISVLYCANTTSSD